MKRHSGNDLIVTSSDCEVYMCLLRPIVFKTTYSETLRHTEEANKAEIKERDKKIEGLVEMIDDLEAKIKDQNIVLNSNNSYS
jgi:hypothetical protein